MTDLQLLALSAFIFVGLPALVLALALLIDRLKPSEQLAQKKIENQTARRYRPF